MNEFRKSIFSFLLRFGVSAGLLYFIFSKIEIGKTIEVLKSADRINLAWALCIFFIVHMLLLFRWMFFIYALNLTASIRNITRHFFIGLFGNLFLPTAIGGDVLKTVGLCNNSDQKPRVVASVLLDRLSGFTSISFVAVCAYVFGYRLIEEKLLLVPIIAMGAGLVMSGFLIFNRKIYTFSCRIFKAFPKIDQGLITMHDDIMLLKSNKASGFKALGVACIGQIVYAVNLYFIAKALHQDIALVYFLIFTPIICVVSIVPSIGGLGVREVGAVYLFGMIGVESGIAASITLIIFIFMVVIGLIGGIFYVITVPDRRLQRDQPDGIGEPEAGRTTP